MNKIKRTISILFGIAMLLVLMSATALADEIFPTDVGADFTSGDGSAALNLLNAAKTGSEDSTWDGSTLILNGVNYNASESGALKLPKDATIVLADGTTNTITGGNASVNVSGEYNNKVYIYGIYAEGNLTIKGGEAGTGTLTVTGGDITNIGNSYTYSAGLYAAGNLIVEGGTITANGGTAKNTETVSNGYATSVGVKLARYKNLTVTGGSLTGIGGKALDNSGDKFSYGIYVYEGNTTVSGSGKLTGQCVNSMAENGLAYGIHILDGNLYVSGSAEVSAKACTAIEVTNGSVALSGGRITADAAETGRGGLRIYKDTSTNSAVGNLTVSGGELTVTGKGIYMYQYNPTDKQGVFSVSSSGKVTTPSISGANKLNITGGTVESGYVDANAVTVDSGALTIREAVKTYEEEGVSHAYASPAITCKNLTVSGGTLDAAWVWGETTPMVVDTNSYTGEPKPLIYIKEGGTAAFSGGTTLLDTGCAGNVVINVKPTLKNDVNKTGDTWSLQGDNYREQMFSDTPVVFSDVTRTPVRVTGVNAENKTYDNSISAKLSGGTLTGVYDGDTVSVGMDSIIAQFEDKNVGKGKAVTILSGGLCLHGRDSYKYILDEQPNLTDLTADITPCTVVFDTTEHVQTIYKGTGTFDQPHIIGLFGDPAEGLVLVDADTGTVTYTVTDAVTDGTYKDVVEYLKTQDSGTEVTVTYKFTGNDNYAEAKFADADGNFTMDTGTITIKVINRSSSSSHTGFTLTFDTNGGSAVGSISGASGTTVDLSRYQPTKEGFTFAGWFSDEALTQAVTSVKLTKNTAVYAKWTENKPVGMPFGDVTDSDWFYDDVMYVFSKGMMEGTGTDIFSPNAATTRGMIVTILYRMEGEPAVSGTGVFDDVEAGQWYTDAVKWAAENGIVAGYGDSRFGLEDNITREQLAAILYRYASYKGVDMTKTADLSDFTDSGKISGYAEAALSWANAEGLINGNGDGTLNPLGSASRAEVSAILHRFCENIMK